MKIDDIFEKFLIIYHIAVFFAIIAISFGKHKISILFFQSEKTNAKCTNVR